MDDLVSGEFRTNNQKGRYIETERCEVATGGEEPEEERGGGQRAHNSICTA